MKTITDSAVLFVSFYQKDGKWIAQIPHAYGKDQPWEQEVSESLTIQFQPMAAVVAYPLTKKEEDK